MKNNLFPINLSSKAKYSILLNISFRQRSKHNCHHPVLFVFRTTVSRSGGTHKRTRTKKVIKNNCSESARVARQVPLRQRKTNKQTNKQTKQSKQTNKITAKPPASSHHRTYVFSILHFTPLTLNRLGGTKAIHKQAFTNQFEKNNSSKNPHPSHLYLLPCTAHVQLIVLMVAHRATYGCASTLLFCTYAHMHPRCYSRSLRC